MCVVLYSILNDRLYENIPKKLFLDVQEHRNVSPSRKLKRMMSIKKSHNFNISLNE